jgi:photosystem II stability/assembly factor-like uncharacterized protein
MKNTNEKIKVKKETNKTDKVSDKVLNYFCNKGFKKMKTSTKNKREITTANKEFTTSNNSNKNLLIKIKKQNKQKGNKTMKTRNLLIAVLLLVTVMFLGTANAQWVEQNSGTTDNLISISAPTSQVAWVCGQGKTVLRTSNGGSEWVDKSIPDAGNLISIYACSKDKAFVTGTGDNGFTVIFMTTDRGDTWERVLELSPNYVFNSIAFFDNNEGIACGDPDQNNPVPNYFTIYKTVNGGLNWEPIQNPPVQIGNSYGAKNSLAIVGSSVFFGATQLDENFNFGPDAFVYKSSDFGETWTVSKTPGVVQVSSLHFSDSKRGFGCRAKTESKGNTWTSMKDPFAVAANDNLHFISSTAGTGKELWATGVLRDGYNYFNDPYVNSLNLYYSNDEGETWILDYVSHDGGLTMAKISADKKALFVLRENGGISMKVLPEPAGTILNQQDKKISGKNYVLESNFPNPFNPTTTIKFQIPAGGLVTLKVYDMVGREVATLVNEVKNPGIHSVQFNASNLSSGTYFYKIVAGSYSDIKRMTLIK